MVRSRGQNYLGRKMQRHARQNVEQSRELAKRIGDMEVLACSHCGGAKCSMCDYTGYCDDAEARLRLEAEREARNQLENPDDERSEGTDVPDPARRG